MDLKTTLVFAKNEAAIVAKKRLIINCGGTSSSKTFSIIQLLVSIAFSSEIPLLISIVSESFPHSRRGTQRDFRAIMGEAWIEDKWNKSESIYDYGKVKIEFFSADDATKLRGGRRDILFINEANNITKEAFDELDVRTRKFTIIDFNPTGEFWAMEMEGRPEVEWIHSTYVDALEVIEKSVVDNIVSRRERDPAWWRIYGLGLVGKIEGLVHPMFGQCDDLPEGGREIYGMDFGYSMDPAVLVKCKIFEDTIFSKELFYEKGMTNDAIAKRFETLGIRKGHDVIIADSAEPKSIAEIKAYGFDIRPCEKGRDSVNAGIQKVNQYKQAWTKDSLNCIKEQRNYRWEKDTDGKFTTKPIGDWDHGMSARRYAISTIPESKVLPIVNIKIEPFILTWDRTKIPETEALHYAAISMTEDMVLHLVCSIWDCIAGMLYIYHAEDIENFSPETAVPALVQIMHLNEFYFEKFLANDKMLSDNRSIARVFNREFIKACPMQQIKLREPKRYDAFGAVALANQVINQGRLTIHNSCEDMIQVMQHWRVEGGKVAVEGLIESLMMLISELDQKEVVRPHIMLGDYKKLYEFPRKY